VDDRQPPSFRPAKPLTPRFSELDAAADRADRRLMSASTDNKQTELSCRCPVELPGSKFCPNEFTQEDFLCNECRKLHKPLYDASWHTGRIDGKET
jgi:hypothetical protein